MQKWILQPNDNWPDPPDPVPRVAVELEVEKNVLQVHWNIQESQATFRAEVLEDGGPCWQDSCVEIFLKHLDDPDIYSNFEFNSKGFCLAAIGPDRHSRKIRGSSDLCKILRKCHIEDREEQRISWTLSISIPLDLIGASSSVSTPNVYGNIYKCGDKSSKPHWLRLFPIGTPIPDFHRPEFFGLLNP